MIPFLNTLFRIFSKKIFPSNKSIKQSSIKNSENWLEETYYLDHTHPTIKNLVATLVSNTHSSKEKAILLHNFVRDKILFGFEPELYDMKASEVLTKKRGYCNTKSTLLIALLRAANIPARQHFVALSSKILDGIVNPGTDYVDHSYCEVYLENTWIPFDSYIVDPELFKNSKHLLKNPLGLGIRIDAQNDWDGIQESFSQFNKNYMQNDYGTYRDVGDFYARAKNPSNKLGILEAVIFACSTQKINKKIDEIRNKSLWQ